MSFLSFLILYLGTFIGLSHGAKHGVIGYGITMYKPVCAYACHDSMSSLYLNCTTFQMAMSDGMSMKLAKRMMGMDMEGVTTDACRSSNAPWLQSLAYCIQEHCTAENVSYHDQAKVFGVLAADLETIPSFRDSIPLQPPTIELTEDETWLNYTMLVNTDLYDANRATLHLFEYQEERHTQYSLITYALVIGTCVVAAALSLLLNVFPSLNNLSIRKHFTLPATFGSRHLEPLPYNIGYVPDRPLTAFIIIYTVLNIIFSCVDYISAQPNTWFPNRPYEVAEYVANRTGIMSLANLGIAILFAGRNNIMIWVTGWSQTRFLTFHRWAARVATVQALVHSINYTAVYFWNGGAKAYYGEAAKAYYWWGIIATVALGLMVALAMLPIRLRTYEFFLFTHIVLAILALMGCWYHLDIRFEKQWGYEVWLYLCFSFWAFDRTVRLIRLTVFNWAGKPPTQISVVPGTDFVEVTIFPTLHPEIGPGQHTFIYVPRLGRFWENHPFTIAAWGYTPPNKVDQTQTEAPFRPEKMNEAITTVADVRSDYSSSDIEMNSPVPRPSPTGKFFIKTIIRANSGMTRVLLERLSKSNTHMTVLTEGPYGGHSHRHGHALRTADTVLLISGGIGITNALGYVQKYNSETLLPAAKRDTMRHTNRMVLAWSAREMPLIEFVYHRFLPLPLTNNTEPEDRRIDYNFYCTRPICSEASSKTTHNAKDSPDICTSQKLNVHDTLRAVMEKGKKIVVVVCAPGGMADEIRKETVACVRDGFSVDLVEEAFTW